MDFSRFDKLAQYRDVADVLILDTTDLALNEVAENLANWIKSTETLYFDSYVPNTTYQLELNAKDSYKTVDQKLFEFNKSCVPATQSPDVIEINCTVKNGDEVIAGICSDIYIWNILFMALHQLRGHFNHISLN